MQSHEHINKINKTGKKICNSILTSDLSRDGVKKIIESLKLKGYIVSAVLPESPESETFGHFLERFWDYKKSPYIQEKKILGQSIHHRYADIAKKRCRAYWIPRFGNRLLGEITKEDIKVHLRQLATVPQKIGTSKKDGEGNQIFIKRMLKPETVNQVVRCATLALKWAYHNGLTENNCFSGIIWCHVVPEKRLIPTMTEAQKIFSSKWDCESTKLAHLISVCTGLRLGEVQALQIRDVGKDRIFVRHNWSRGEGLKCPKNGEQREILISQKLRSMIQNLISRNPYGQNPGNFLFWGKTKSCPRPTTLWNVELHRVAKNLGIKNSDRITFHCWRHFFATNMADNVDMRKLQLATGHKSLEMLEHYARHESERTLVELGQISNKVFSPILETSLSII